MSPSAPAVLDELAAPRESVRVLLVEDNPGDRVLVREMLREAAPNAVLTGAGRLTEAFEPVARGLADLVLLDLSLPDSFGLDGLRRLRAAAPEVPVVVLSGLADEEVALQAVQAGAQDYLMKGAVDGTSLARAMRYALERQRAERHLARLALRDPLTGLPNRVLFADRLEHALARRGRESGAGRLTLMFIDLDGFKAVNDRLGHLAGDEFTVLCEGAADPEAAVVLATRLAETLAEPYELADGTAEIGAAIGIALARPGEQPAGELLRRADAAMYEAKRAGGGRCALAPEGGA